MKKLILLILSIFIFSCNDPVFYSISMEELPLDPRIAGPSTNFAELNGKMYVAAKKTIYIYENKNDPDTDSWKTKNVSGRVTHLAALENKLYALIENLIIPLSEAITEEAPISVPGQSIQSIFAVENTLFIGTWFRDANNNYAETNSIWYLKEGETQPSQITGGGFSILCGAASDNYNFYLCCKDKNGIFYMPKDTPGTAILVNDSKDKDFTGIINLNAENTAAMSRDGKLFLITSAKITESVKYNDGRKATSAIGIWKNETYSLLLTGKQDLTNTVSTGYTHGYVEIEFNAATGSITGTSFYEPGKIVPSSISENTYEHYSSSIGKHGVNYFYQAPDGVLFASLNNGVWSYRERSAGKFTWNAEE